MRLSIQADLTYSFEQPCEVLLLLEAARAPDQAIHSERLILTPAAEIARLDDSVTGERRAVFTGYGEVAIAYTAQVELLARDANLKGARATQVRDLPGEALRYLRASRYCPSDRFEAFVDRAGVCRDFAHLAISLCRAADIPARAVSAYAWKLEPPDLHAVAEVYLGGRWRLIDATGRAPIDGLVRVATGLDAADIAFMTIFGKADLVSQRFAIEKAKG